MTTTEFNYGVSDTDRVFPFRFVVDQELCIREVGGSLRKLSSRLLPGMKLPTVFEFARASEGALTFEALQKYVHRLVILKLVDSNLRMRGQMLDLENGHLLFVGSPAFESMDDMLDYNLTLHDFAVQDNVLEILIQKQSQQTQMSDLKKMVSELNSAAEERARMEMAEQSLAHDLNSAGDLIVRIAKSGIVIGIRCINQEQLPALPAELIGRPIADSFPSLAAPLQDAIELLDAQEAPVSCKFEVEGIAGTLAYEARITRTLDGNLLLVAREVTERMRLHDQLAHQASHDPLTDLPNRTLFELRVEGALIKDERLAILFIDLDDFKSVNDRYGHQAGDDLLLRVARALENSTRPGDTPARLGGDEFGVLLRGVESEQQAVEIARRLRQTILDYGNRPGKNGVHQGCIGASIGVRLGMQSEESSELFRDADIAMYRAKASTSEKVVLFRQEMYSELVEKLNTRQELEAAILDGEIVNYYQPIVSLENGRIKGLEALARWNHPERGCLSPFAFIETAEENGTIVQLGRCVLRNACLDTQLFNTMENCEFTVNVNVSSLQFERPEFVEEVREALGISQLPPHLLTLEITESALFQNFESAERVFRELKKLGLNVALDDFGVGYASLKYLDRFPIDVLKLDRSFINRQTVIASDLRLVKSIVQLALSLDLEVVAEGIEDIAQEHALRVFGCHYGQGFLYSRPVPITRFGTIVCDTPPIVEERSTGLTAV